MLTFINIPPVPTAFVPVMRAKPVQRSRYDLSPRHQEQYVAFRQWEDGEGGPDTRPVLDPDVEAFIRHNDSFDADYAAWKRELEIERVIQWPAYFLANQPRAFLMLAVAAPIVATISSTAAPGVRNTDIVHDSIRLASLLIEACGVPDAITIHKMREHSGVSE